MNSPIHAKIEISPKGLTLGIKAGKKISLYPKLLINVELYALVLAARLIKGYHQNWEANLQRMEPIFIIRNVGL
jgi:hypothetical protein